MASSSKDTVCPSRRPPRLLRKQYGKKVDKWPEEQQRASATPQTDVWLFAPSPQAPERFTFDPGYDVCPVWSPDGRRIVFASNRSGLFDLFEKPASFARDERVLMATAENKLPVDWSPDGRDLLFVNESRATGDGLWTLPLEEPQKAAPFLARGHDESQGQCSPDGRWVAYRSNESGRWEISLRRYPRPGSQRLVSRGGGGRPGRPALPDVHRPAPDDDDTDHDRPELDGRAGQDSLDRAGGSAGVRRARRPGRPASSASSRGSCRLLDE